MLFYPAEENGVWEVLVEWDDPASVRFTRNQSQSFRHVMAPPQDIGAQDIGEGEFTTRAFRRDGFSQTLSIFFRPTATLNPNLDGDTYEIHGAHSLLMRKEPRRTAPRANPLSLDFRDIPRLHDFARDFWRQRESQLHPIDQPGRTVINMGIAASGAGSWHNSLRNSGWQLTDCLMDHDFMLRAMHALSVGATQMTPHYPQILRTHHWGQIDAVVPNAAYCTVLRDPIRRLISHYGFAVDIGSTQDDPETHFAKVCENGLANTQLVWMGHQGGPLPWSLLPYQVLPQHFQRGPEGMVQSQALVEYANAALSKFFFIGMNEYYDESLCLAALLMRSPTVGRWRMMHRSSASASGYTLSARTRSRLETCYGPEIEFYETQRAKFLETYGEELAFLKTHVGSLRID